MIVAREDNRLEHLGQYLEAYSQSLLPVSDASSAAAVAAAFGSSSGTVAASPGGFVARGNAAHLQQVSTFNTK
jgi:hypothetical protein